MIVREKEALGAATLWELQPLLTRRLWTGFPIVRAEERRFRLAPGFDEQLLHQIKDSIDRRGASSPGEVVLEVGQKRESEIRAAWRCLQEKLALGRLYLSLIIPEPTGEVVCFHGTSTHHLSRIQATEGLRANQPDLEGKLSPFRSRKEGCVFVHVNNVVGAVACAQWTVKELRNQKGIAAQPAICVSRVRPEELTPDLDSSFSSFKIRLGQQTLPVEEAFL